MPTREHFEMLIQRLGYSDTMLDVCVDEKQFHLHELKFQIRQAIILNQMDFAEKMLVEYESCTNKPTQIEQQFIILCRTIINTNLYSANERLNIFEQAIKLTCPKYEEGKFPQVLSYEEIIIINNIAVSYFQMGDCESAISVLFHVKRFYDYRVINTEEVLRTQPLILYNLSKYLGCAGRYDECIEITDIGIRIARQTGRSSYLDGMLYNRAWALIRRNRPGDKEASLSSAKQAYYLSLIMEKQDLEILYKNFLASQFEEKVY